MQESLLNTLKTAINKGNLEEIDILFNQEYEDDSFSSIVVSKTNLYNFEFLLTFNGDIKEDYVFTILKKCNLAYLKTGNNTILFKEFINNNCYNSLLINMYH
jgi:hypothetical protein